MARFISYRLQLAMSFLASLYVGYTLPKHEDAEERFRTTVLANLVATLGIVIGYKLGGGD
ncbi:hypothetical protein [Halorussus sp. AFM4]|uniref:hypothetical protein n=1 Tax=Halorussus sp. AFM4 TaxID=3421651 RepID=UPI003EBACD76